MKLLLSLHTKYDILLGRHTGITGASPHRSPVESSTRGEEVEETKRTANYPELVNNQPDVWGKLKLIILYSFSCFFFL